MSKAWLFLIVLVSCEDAKKEKECNNKYIAYFECAEKLYKDGQTDKVKLFTEMCEMKKETYPCKLTNEDIKDFADIKCPPVRGCK